jgi:ubiquinone/menaquinone biosynthesis C-methylase UbiE
MQLLSEQELVWSPIVANSRMNRGRNASGVNSYEKEFKFRPEAFLESKIKEYGKASWLDLCCGEGIALLQTAAYLSENGLQDKIRLKGIDLLDLFKPGDSRYKFMDFEVMSVVDWVPDQQYDLITCSHGLHYLGDKLKAIQTALRALNAQGLFIANLDLTNISIAGVSSDRFLKDIFKKSKIEYNSRTRIIKRVGAVDIDFNLEYKGADDKVGPNYTGQDAVTSYYAVQK